MNVHTVSAKIGELELSIEIGKLAKQADGAAVIRYGDTVLLVTACAAKQQKEGMDFFPLTVDYRENFYAAGKIPGQLAFPRRGRIPSTGGRACAAARGESLWLRRGQSG